MALKKIELADGLPETVETLSRQGLLLSTVDPEGKPNVMTIGWGNPGIIWGRPIFVVYVRPSRFTFGNLEATGEFSVNVPPDELHETCLYCGQVSGRDVDKFAETQLTPVEAETVAAPLIRECIRHYECRVVHTNDVSDAAIDAEIRSDCYPAGDLHRVYYGQVLRTTERE